MALAFSFIYSGIASLIAPDAWVGFIPSFISNFIDSYTFLNIFSTFEIILGLWIIWGKGIFYSSALSAFILFGIIVSNLSLLEIIYRDIPIFFVSLALLVLNIEKEIT